MVSTTYLAGILINGIKVSKQAKFIENSKAEGLKGVLRTIPINKTLWLDSQRRYPFDPADVIMVSRMVLVAKLFSMLKILFCFTQVNVTKRNKAEYFQYTYVILN